MKVADGIANRITRASDRALELVVVAFAAWTLVYQLCLVLGGGAPAAAVLTLVALVPAAWWLLATRDPEPAQEPPPPPPIQRPRQDPRLLALLAINVCAAAAAALLFASPPQRWVVIWGLWLTASIAALAAAGMRAPRTGPWADASWWEVGVVLAWAVGLAVLASVLVNPNGDDAYYLHVASWVGDHGRFPLHDVLFSDDRFPALYYPPLPSYEALAGTLANLTSIPAPALVYLAVPPLAAAAAVLALWRLLRAWQAPLAGLALSVALAFLLFDAVHHRMLGSYFIGRLWQGKTLFACILVPLVFALLHEYAQRPGGRRLALAAAASVAAVGLTTSAIFVVPVITAGCLAPLALRAPGRAAVALAATAGYPLAAGLVTLAADGRTPDVYDARDVVPGKLTHMVLGSGLPAALAILAVLIGPLLIGRRADARMVAATVLLVGCLLAPRVPAAIFDLTGLGRVLWRLVWALPVAALVGILAVGLVPERHALVLRALPAVVVAVALVLGGRAVWSDSGGIRVQARIASGPAWKQPPARLATARRVLANARPGDLILAPGALSWTLAAISGDTATVSPRRFYTHALRAIPAARARERLLLQRVADGRLGPDPRKRAHAQAVLRTLGVDIACMLRSKPGATALVARAGYGDLVATSRAVGCYRRGPR